ncbi:Gamma-aminobutyrate:alpha-ketoglutarate aminotransferase [hydrothermal vent metagenome]|uniref:Gamma-aminobutyrate:alpha-ketoglutarate aminotransferase n=1 Tax=hydrothermal vent metagenome TaxID=652676 RepID=A0A3B0UXM5_9ZZZZ
MKLNLAGAGPLGQAMIQRDTDVLSPSFAREYALVVDTAEGSELWDVDGKRYVDFMAGVAVLNVGHRHPRVVEAVREQLDKFWHICLADFYYPQAVELAEKLRDIAPMNGRSRLFFSNSGTEAVEAAIKLAMYKTGRSRFIGFLGAFHGRTLGSLSFTASKSVQVANYVSGVPVLHLPFPNDYRPVLAQSEGQSSGDAVIDYLENLVFRTTLAPEDVAAILVEPIQGEGGYIVPSPGFFSRLREICDKHGILLIVDEIQSGVGRTGKWWAVEYEDIQPDIVCFAKGVGSGMPIGGIIAPEDIMIWKPGAHGSTFGGNPVAAVSALTTLQVIEEENLLAKANETGGFIMDALIEMEGRHPSLGDVRGRGLMIGMEFVKDRESKERAVELRDHVIQHAFENGLLLIPCGTNSIRMTPPLNIPHNLVEEGLHIFEVALTDAEAKFL